MRNPVLRTCALVVAVASLGGCATAYQAKGLTGGFSETVLSPDTFKIDFKGNGYTSNERASDFAVLRAADKSLELGCNYFGIMNEANGASVGSATVGTGGWNGHSAWSFASSFPIVMPDSSLFVKCFRENVAGQNLFDAHFVAQSIRAKYGIKTPIPGGTQQPSVAPQGAPAPGPVTSAAPVADEAHAR